MKILRKPTKVEMIYDILIVIMGIAIYTTLNMQWIKEMCIKGNCVKVPEGFEIIALEDNGTYYENGWVHEDFVNLFLHEEIQAESKDTKIYYLSSHDIKHFITYKEDINYIENLMYMNKRFEEISHGSKTCTLSKKMLKKITIDKDKSKTFFRFGDCVGLIQKETQLNVYFIKRPVKLISDSDFSSSALFPMIKDICTIK